MEWVFSDIITERRNPQIGGREMLFLAILRAIRLGTSCTVERKEEAWEQQLEVLEKYAGEKNVIRLPFPESSIKARLGVLKAHKSNKQSKITRK